MTMSVQSEYTKRVEDRVFYLESALRKIAKREGRFSRDHLTHAGNTIEDMSAIAETALTGTWEQEP